MEEQIKEQILCWNNVIEDCNLDIRKEWMKSKMKNQLYSSGAEDQVRQVKLAGISYVSEIKELENITNELSNLLSKVNQLKKRIINKSNAS